jgi:uncharacterized protein (DUF4415 family)
MKKTAKAAATAASQDLPPELLAQLQAAAELPDDQINTADPDAPEVADWTGATRGRFYKPNKELKSLRLDADVLAWFQAQGPGYQTRINRTLRAAMLLGIRRQKRGMERKQSA